MAMINEHYPAESWIHVSTDGSTTNVASNGSACVFIKFTQGYSSTAKVLTSTYNSNYKLIQTKFLQFIDYITMDDLFVIIRNSPPPHANMQRILQKD